MPNGVVMAAFAQGQIPQIACFNKATVALGVDLDALIAALQKFVDEKFAPIWGTHAKLVKSEDFIPNSWAIAFLDNADVQDDLGYHDLTPDGLPLSKIFVKTILADGQKVSVTACHELAEMLVDPAINLWAEGLSGTLYAYETCDAVEEEEFLLDGIPLSDFVYPSYFESFRAPGSTQFDFLGHVSRPFEILPGGYALLRKGEAISHIFGSVDKRTRFQEEDRRGHRSDYRWPSLALRWRSEPKHAAAI